MGGTKHVVLIHGSFSRGEQLAPARAAFEERGYTAHTPTLRQNDQVVVIARRLLRGEAVYEDDREHPEASLG